MIGHLEIFVRCRAPVKLASVAATRGLTMCCTAPAGARSAFRGFLCPAAKLGAKVPAPFFQNARGETHGAKRWKKEGAPLVSAVPRARLQCSQEVACR